MPQMIFIMKNGAELAVDAPKGLSVMEIAHQHGLQSSIEGACGGSLACATCHVWVHPDWAAAAMPKGGDLTEDEEDMLDLAFDLGKTSRLSCQIIMDDHLDGLVVALPGADVDWA